MTVLRDGFWGRTSNFGTWPHSENAVSRDLAGGGYAGFSSLEKRSWFWGICVHHHAELCPRSHLLLSMRSTKDGKGLRVMRRRNTPPDLTQTVRTADITPRTTTSCVDSSTALAARGQSQFFVCL